MKKEEKIVTRPFQFGNEKESEWPPRFGTGGSGHFYWDEETRKFKEGYPPPKYPRYGQAPAVISDTMEPYFHPRAQMLIESKSQLREVDKACGTFTSDRNEKCASDPWTECNKVLKKDREEALAKAIAQCDAGTAPLTEEQRAMCRANDERLAAAMPGFDPFNAVGRISNARGKRYKKRIKRRTSRS